MFNHRHYVPILKTKRGERRALSLLFAADQPHITPLLELAEADFDPAPGQPFDPAFDTRIGAAAGNIAQCWPTGRPLFVDGILLDPSAILATGIHPLEQVFSDARTQGLEAIPVTGLDRGSAYQAAVAAIAATDQRGAVIRLTLDDIDGSPLAADLNALLDNLHLSAGNCHLVLDAGELNGVSSALVVALRHAITTLPHLHDWQSFTLAASAFPRDLAAISIGRGQIRRSDWLLYQQLVSHPLARIQAFGDYTSRHTEMFGGDGSLINASASVRYTIQDDWLILRGMGTRSRGSGGFTQYCQHAATLRTLPEYAGAAFSAGDQEIDTIGQRTANCGNHETWVWISVNHHITFAARQIQALPSSPTFP